MDDFSQRLGNLMTIAHGAGVSTHFQAFSALISKNRSVIFRVARRFRERFPFCLDVGRKQSALSLFTDYELKIPGSGQINARGDAIVLDHVRFLCWRSVIGRILRGINEPFRQIRMSVLRQ